MEKFGNLTTLFCFFLLRFFLNYLLFTLTLGNSSTIFTLSIDFGSKKHIKKYKTNSPKDLMNLVLNCIAVIVKINVYVNCNNCET